VQVIWREGKVLFVEYRGLIHVIPERVKVTGAFKNLWLHKVFPKRLSVLIKEINPATLSWPRSTSVSIASGVPHENVGYVAVSLAGHIVFSKVVLFNSLKSFLQA
jgi:hypothetical protein